MRQNKFTSSNRIVFKEDWQFQQCFDEGLFDTLIWQNVQTRLQNKQLFCVIHYSIRINAIKVALVYALDDIVTITMPRTSIEKVLKRLNDYLAFNGVGK